MDDHNVRIPCIALQGACPYLPGVWNHPARIVNHL